MESLDGEVGYGVDGTGSTTAAATTSDKVEWGGRLKSTGSLRGLGRLFKRKSPQFST